MTGTATQTLIMRLNRFLRAGRAVLATVPDFIADRMRAAPGHLAVPVPVKTNHADRLALDEKRRDRIARRLELSNGGEG